MKMGLGSDHINGRMGPSKEIKKGVMKKEEMRGCLIGFLVKCIAPKTKVDGSSTISSAQHNESNKSFSNFSKNQQITSQLRKFTFNELKSATRNFRPGNIIGEGGFGCVFKGWIRDNGSVFTKYDQPVAVKTLNRAGLQGHKEWLAEVYFLGDLVHPNLVKLVGYCMEDDQRMLVYEFMPRGSLDHHLFRRAALPLPWKLRLKIALGAAKGLAFLHEEAERPVIYRDFKSSNILLDKDYNVKLSDFGLAKDGPEGDKTHVSTRVLGTYGYAAPEYVMTGHLTLKSDVYSFGVVFLEMLSGRRSMDRTKPRGQQNLLEWAKPYIADKHRCFQLIDQRLEGQFSIKVAQKAIQVAARCLNRDPKTRPLMSEVVEALKVLTNLTDMTPYSQRMQTAQSNNINQCASNVTKQQDGSPFRNSQVTRTSSLFAQHGSPLMFNHLQES